MLPALSLDSSDQVQAELSFWEQFPFSYDMDNNDLSHNSSPPRDARRAHPSPVSTTRGPGGDFDIANTQDAALLAHFISVAGMSQTIRSLQEHPSSSGYDDHLLRHPDIGHTQLPHLSSLELPWHPFPPQLQPNQFSQMQRGVSASSSSYPHGETSLIPQNTFLPEGSGRLSKCSSLSATATVSTSERDSNQTELERGGTAEEKRRRNTEASARFRIKKKQKTLELERTISDLKGRAEDLEREAGDLRRENGWLKEIVMLKGSRLAGANLASHIMAESVQRATEQDSSKRVNDSSDGDSSDAEEALTSNRKGKSCKR